MSLRITKDPHNGDIVIESNGKVLRMTKQAGETARIYDLIGRNQEKTGDP